MKVFITGGTGFVGTTLTQKLAQEGNKVTVLTRSVKSYTATLQGVSYVEGDPTQKGRWQGRVADHDVVINLAGASIFRRWSDSAKRLIWTVAFKPQRTWLKLSRQGRQRDFSLKYLRRRLLRIPRR